MFNHYSDGNAEKKGCKMTALKIIIFILFCNLGFAQDNLTWEYNLTHGLPSTTCYNLMESKSGEIWFGSDHGVTRFNGQKFTTYTIEDGLNENTVLICFEDSYGRIWFHHGEKFPSYYYKGDIYKTKGNEEQVIYRASRFAQTKDGTVILGGNNGLFCFDSKGRVSLIELTKKLDYAVINKIDDKIYILNPDSKPLKIKGSEIISINNLVFPGSSNIKLNFNGYMRSFESVYPKRKDAQFLSIISNNDLGAVYQIKQVKDCLYFATSSGLYKFQLVGGEWKKINHSFKNHNVVSLLLKEQGLWLSIWGKGIIHQGFSGMPKHNLPFEGKISFIKNINNTFYFGDFQSQVYKLNEDFTIETYSVKTDRKDETNIYDVLDGNNNLLVISGFGLFSVNKKTKVSHQLYSSNHILKKGIYIPNQDEHIYSLGTGMGFITMNMLTNELDLEKRFSGLPSVRDMAYFRGQLYLATSKGLWKYFNGEMSKVKSEIFNDTRINALYISGDNLLIGTNGEGLWNYDIVSCKKLETSNRYDLGFILKMTPSSGETFWVLTNGVIQKFYLEDDRLLQIQAIDLRSELNSTEITHITEFKRQLYTLSKNGVNVFPTGSNQKIKPLTLIQTGLKISNNISPFADTLHLNLYQYIQMDFNAINFSKHPSKYYYRVNGSDWKSFERGNLQLNFINSGEHKVEVKANSNFQKSLTPLVFIVVVESDWTTNTNILLIVICFFLSILLFLKIRKLAPQISFWLSKRN
ncbi:MAG: ligand-binding sensor domain-containing protein [Psychromonas sp.]|jgi:ligand-binding sensor domain-containing protein